ncbi:hypothetical protein O2313_07915 [Bacillus amyloliquefaciens]|nr:hypothetical protein [Bacillus amyloliquefaciens]MCZ4247442.1 hypothetical protein [Bacillus amyloliquefaciens]
MKKPDPSIEEKVTVEVNRYELAVSTLDWKQEKRILLYQGI